MIVVTKEMTDEERAETLARRAISVCSYVETEENKFVLSDPSKKVGTLIREYAKNIGFTGTRISLEGIDGCAVKTSNGTVKESINLMMKNSAHRGGGTVDFIPLLKLFSVIEDVAKEAVLIQVEPNRHMGRADVKIDNVKHYVSAFCDDKSLYPVKILAITYRGKSDVSVKLTVTVEEIGLEEIKRKVANGGMHPCGESHPSLAHPSFDITIPQLLSFFNEKQGLLIKNFPDSMLTREQKEVKEAVTRHDTMKEREFMPIPTESMVFDDAEEEIEK